MRDIASRRRNLYRPRGSKGRKPAVESGYIDFFSFDADAMVGGAKFLICPTKEEGPRCLTFSLRGFTAALKTVCPKR